MMRLHYDAPLTTQKGFTTCFNLTLLITSSPPAACSISRGLALTAAGVVAHHAADRSIFLLWCTVYDLTQIR